MILMALNDLYYRLLTQYEESGSKPKCVVPTYGFSDEKIGYLLVLDEDGNLKDVQNNLREIQKGKKTISEPRLMRLPCSFVRSGKFTEQAFSEGKNVAFFLWDKPEYLLGVTLNGNRVEISELPFCAFKAKQLQLIGDSNDKGLRAVARFLEKWKPQNFEAESKLKPEMLKLNFAFKLEGDLGCIAEREEAVKIWTDYWGSLRNKATRQCLVSGEVGTLAKTHTPLKVPGGKTSGVAIVTYNENAYESFGKSQGDNAPVSEDSAFAYTTALNYMLRRENGHCLSIGDTTTVFWARTASAEEEREASNFFSSFFSPPTDESQKEKLRFALEKIAKGRPFEEIAPDLDSKTRFYVLGVAPNAARLSIRFWLDSTLGELGERIAQHWRNILIDPLPWNEGKPPSVWLFLLQLTTRRKKPNGDWQNRDAKKNPPPAHLSGEFFRAVISGTPYPISILTKILDCIRSDGDINGLRVALIKGILIRNFPHQLTKEIPVALNIEHPNPAYQLGCQFALFEKAQYAALGKLNASVKDKYFGTASANPRTVFATLHRNFSHHVADLRKGKKYEKWKGDPQIFAAWLEKRTGEISNKLTEHYPAQLSLSEQGLFVLGYYHQRFVSKTKDTTLAVALKDESDEIEAVIETDQDTSE